MVNPLVCKEVLFNGVIEILLKSLFSLKYNYENQVHLRIDNLSIIL